MDTTTTVTGDSPPPTGPAERADLRQDRTSYRAQWSMAILLLIAICILWSVVAIARAHELDSLAAEQNRTPPTVEIGGHTAAGATPAKATSSTGGESLEIVLAAISITLVLIGTAVRAFTTDAKEEMLEERVDKIVTCEHKIKRLHRRTVPVRMAKNKISATLDTAVETVWNDIHIQTAHWTWQRFTRATMRRVTEGVWRSTGDRTKFAALNPFDFVDGRLPGKNDIKTFVSDIRAKAIDDRRENQVLAVRDAFADKRLADLNVLTEEEIRNITDRAPVTRRRNQSS